VWGFEIGAKMKKLIVTFLTIFALSTILNDFYTFMGYEGFHQSISAKYFVAFLVALGLYLLNIKAKSTENPSLPPPS
jgi:hypothetical protein